MSNLDGVLEAIDACLDDYLSPDAMRWAPGEPDPTREGEPFSDQVARLVEWMRHVEIGHELADWQRLMLLNLPQYGTSNGSLDAREWQRLRVVSTMPGREAGEPNA
ncbi:hypothetical protein ABZ917_17610 [Nonomuraea wenchangensis]